MFFQYRNWLHWAQFIQGSLFFFLFYPFNNLSRNVELRFSLYKLEKSRRCTSTLLIIVVSGLDPDSG